MENIHTCILNNGKTLPKVIHVKTKCPYCNLWSSLRVIDFIVKNIGIYVRDYDFTEILYTNKYHIGCNYVSGVGWEVHVGTIGTRLNLT